MQYDKWPDGVLILKRARVRECQGTAARYQTVCARWYFKPASGLELDDAGHVGVAPGRGWGVSCRRNTQVFQFPKSSAE